MLYVLPDGASVVRRNRPRATKLRFAKREGLVDRNASAGWAFPGFWPRSFGGRGQF